MNTHIQAGPIDVLEDRVRRRVRQIHIVYVPPFTARRLLELHPQREALEADRDAAHIRLGAVAPQLRAVGQKDVRLLVLVELIAVLDAEQAVGADQDAGGRIVVGAVDAVDGRGGRQRGGLSTTTHPCHGTIRFFFNGNCGLLERMCATVTIGLSVNLVTRGFLVERPSSWRAAAQPITKPA